MPTHLQAMDNSIANIGKQLGSAFGGGSTNLQQASAQQQQANRQQFVQACLPASPAAEAVTLLRLHTKDPSCILAICLLSHCNISREVQRSCTFPAVPCIRMLWMLCSTPRNRKPHYNLLSSPAPAISVSLNEA